MIAHHNQHEPRGRIVVELTFWQASALLVAAQTFAERMDDPDVRTATERAARKLERGLLPQERRP